MAKNPSGHPLQARRHRRAWRGSGGRGVGHASWRGASRVTRHALRIPRPAPRIALGARPDWTGSEYRRHRTTRSAHRTGRSAERTGGSNARSSREWDRRNARVAIGGMGRGRRASRYACPPGSSPRRYLIAARDPPSLDVSRPLPSRAPPKHAHPRPSAAAPRGRSCRVQRPRQRDRGAPPKLERDRVMSRSTAGSTSRCGGRRRCSPDSRSTSRSIGGPRPIPPKCASGIRRPRSTSAFARSSRTAPWPRRSPTAIASAPTTTSRSTSTRSTSAIARFVFIVNPLGVQADGTKSEGGGFIPGSNVMPGQNDLSADFIWQSRGHVTRLGLRGRGPHSVQQSCGIATSTCSMGTADRPPRAAQRL